MNAHLFKFRHPEYIILVSGTKILQDTNVVDVGIVLVVVLTGMQREARSTIVTRTSRRYNFTIIETLRKRSTTRIYESITRLFLVASLCHSIKLQKETKASNRLSTKIRSNPQKSK